VLNPVVNFLRKRLHIHRIIATIIAFTIMIGAIVLLGFLVWPSISDQAQELAEEFPVIYEDSAKEMEGIVSDLGFEVDLWSYEQLEDFLNDPENQDQIISAALDRLGAFTSGLFEAILVFFVAPVVAFYVLIDLPRIRKESEDLIPPAQKDETVYLSRQLGWAVGGFLRGQVLVAIIVGVMMSFGYWLIGLRFWLIIGMISGFLNIVPFIGPWIGGFLGVVVALVTADVGTALWAGVVALIVQQLDNNFISPTVLRATVRLHPAVVVLLLILGGAVGGIWGLILVVPVAASLKIVFGHFWRTRILGQSWQEATDAIIEEKPPEPLLGRIRRAAEEDIDAHRDPDDNATATVEMDPADGAEPDVPPS
jgi:predicted PurR-regulated permease PerM